MKFLTQRGPSNRGERSLLSDRPAPGCSLGNTPHYGALTRQRTVVVGGRCAEGGAALWENQ